MKRVILIGLLFLGACGPETQGEIDAAAPSPADRIMQDYSGAPTYMGSASKFPLWFDFLNPGCLNAWCDTPDQKTEQNSDPVESPRNIGVSTTEGPQSQDVVLDGDINEPTPAPREEYIPIDVKIEFEHE